MKNKRHVDAVKLLLADVASHTGQGVLFYDSGEQHFLMEGNLPVFCRRCLSDSKLAQRCRATYEEAASNALSTAEPFHYTCWAGLLFAAVAIAPFAHCIGCLAVGGFRTALDDDTGRLNDIGVLRSLDLPGLSRLRKLFAIAPVISTAQLRGLGDYLQDASFASGLNSSEYFRRQHEVYVQQRAIAEYSQRLRPADIRASALVRRADALVDGIVRANEEQRRRQCAAYLAAILQACHWDIARLKAHLRVPLAMLARNAVLRGDDWSVVTRAELRFVERLDQARTIEDVCHRFHEILLDFALRATQKAGIMPALSERIVRWLEDNYQKSATMGAASRSVGASVPSIIKHIRHDTGKTFHGLLLEIRIAEAKRLLATTDLDLSAIAQQCGFCDQSHFTRHFRKGINLTPGRFRELMAISEMKFSNSFDRK